MRGYVSGRFKVVRLPLKILKEKLGNSKTQALRRFYALERRLTKNEPLRLAYITGLNDYINEGHRKRVIEDSSFLTYHIPHHTVIKEHSTSIKFRIVFDASMSSTSHLSLNQCLMKGPVVQSNLFSVLIRS